MAVVSFLAARSQLLHPNLSVAIFAQNGVYSFFSIAFVPIVFGIFYKNTSLKTAVAGSVTALLTYFTVYYICLYTHLDVYKRQALHRWWTGNGINY